VCARVCVCDVFSTSRREYRREKRAWPSGDAHLGGALHLGEDHGGDLLGRQAAGVAAPAHLDEGAVVAAVNDAEGKPLHLLAHHRVVPGPPDDALDVVQGVSRVHGGLVLGGLAHDAASGGEGHKRGGRAGPHRVGEDLRVTGERGEGGLEGGGTREVFIKQTKNADNW